MTHLLIPISAVKNWTTYVVHDLCCSSIVSVTVIPTWSLHFLSTIYYTLLMVCVPHCPSCWVYYKSIIIIIIIGCRAIIPTLFPYFLLFCYPYIMLHFYTLVYREISNYAPAWIVRRRGEGCRANFSNKHKRKMLKWTGSRQNYKHWG